MLPARALPVPFWACGLRPPPRTSALESWRFVPARPPARYAVTTWWTRASLYSRPKVASATSTSAAPLPAFTTLSFMGSDSGSLLRLRRRILRGCLGGGRDPDASALRRAFHGRPHHHHAAFG